MDSTDNRTYEFSKIKKSAKSNYGIILDKKQDWSFFATSKNEFKLNKQCEKCQFLKECGQSHKAELVACKKYKKISDNKTK